MLSLLSTVEAGAALLSLGRQHGRCCAASLAAGSQFHALFLCRLDDQVAQTGIHRVGHVLILHHLGVGVNHDIGESLGRELGGLVQKLAERVAILGVEIAQAHFHEIVLRYLIAHLVGGVRDRVAVDVALLVLAGRGVSLGRQLSDEVGSSGQRVAILGVEAVAGVGVLAMEAIGACSRGEVLHREGRGVVAVHVDDDVRLSTYILLLEVVGGTANVLVLREDEVEVAMLQFLVVEDGLDERDEDRAARLVVGAQQRGSVTRDDGLAHTVGQGLPCGVSGLRVMPAGSWMSPPL